MHTKRVTGHVCRSVEGDGYVAIGKAMFVDPCCQPCITLGPSVAGEMSKRASGLSAYMCINQLPTPSSYQKFQASFKQCSGALFWMEQLPFGKIDVFDEWNQGGS